MIKVYPSRLEGEPLEQHETTGLANMRGWLAINAPDITDVDAAPLTIHKNGEPATLDTAFCASDVVEVWVEPRGAIVMAVVAFVASLALSMLMRPKVPKQNPQGKALDSPTLDANSARYGDPIPEIFGRPARIYPDYLVPPRTYYTAPRVQWIEMFLCFGKGRFEKDIADVYVGDTRATALGDDIQIQFYEPGANVSGQRAADWWHTPAEVGFTARGTSGMELGQASGRTASVDASAFNVAGDLVTVATGSAFPADWIAGVELRIEVPYAAVITNGATRDVITSPYAFSHFDPAVGMVVELSGGVDGEYRIASYTPGSGGTPAVPGSPSTYTGSAAPVRLDFGVTPAGINVLAPAGQNYTVFLNLDYTTPAVLLEAINAQLNGATVVASYEADALRISERAAPFQGAPVVVYGEAHDDLFGTAPMSVTGVATQAAIPGGESRITLDHLDGRPVNELTIGATQIAIAPNNFLYEIVDRVSATVLDVTPKGESIWPGWQPLTSENIYVTLGPDSQQVGWTGPFTVTPPGELVTALEFDTLCPNGLIRYNDKGKRRDMAYTPVYQWRPVAGGPWSERAIYERHMSPDALGFTVRIDLPEPMAVEVRMRRGPKDGRSGGTNNEAIQWTGVRGLMVGRPTAYEGATTMAVRLRTGDRISSRADNKVWARATRILELPDGTMAPTRDIVPALLHVLRDCGYGPERVDMEAAKELHELWNRRVDRFDLAVTTHSTVKRMANDILRAGFAELTIDRGLLTPVRDALRTSPNYIYSPQEFLDFPTVTTELISTDDIDGVDVEYVDEITGKVETIKFRLIGDEGRRAEKIAVLGVTNYTRAWRLAARHRRTMAYRRTTFKGTTELQALNSSYMSYDLVQDGIPEYGQSAFLVARDGLKLTVSEPINWDGNAFMVIALRHRDGKVTRMLWVKPGATAYEMELLEALPFAFTWSTGRTGNVDPTMIYIGTARKVSHEVLITKITPRNDNTVDLDAVIYDPRVYADDDRDPFNEAYLTTGVYAPSDATSSLYPIEFDDTLAVGGVAPKVRYNTWVPDVVGVSAITPIVIIKSTVRYREYRNWPPEAVTVEPLAPTVRLTTSVRYLTYDKAVPERIEVAALAPRVSLKTVAAYISYEDYPIEAVTTAPLPPFVTMKTP